MKKREYSDSGMNKQLQLSTLETSINYFNNISSFYFLIGTQHNYMNGCLIFVLCRLCFLTTPSIVQTHGKYLTPHGKYLRKVAWILLKMSSQAQRNTAHQGLLK